MAKLKLSLLAFPLSLHLSFCSSVRPVSIFLRPTLYQKMKKTDLAPILSYLQCPHDKQRNPADLRKSEEY